MKEIKEFVIDRKVWLRGEGSDISYLLRGTDEKMCCLGIYLVESGVKSANILNHQAPLQLNLNIQIPNWLREEGNSSFHNCQNLMRINDGVFLSEEKREAEIARLFSAQGIKVSFK